MKLADRNLPDSAGSDPEAFRFECAGCGRVCQSNSQGMVEELGELCPLCIREALTSGRGGASELSYLQEDEWP